MLGLHLDRTRDGTLHSDRVHRILGTCHAMGILWTEEVVTNRDGSTYKQRVELVRPRDTVLETPQYHKYGLYVNPRVLARVRGMAPQFAYSLNVPSVGVEVDGDTVWVRIPRECSVEDGAILFEKAWALGPDMEHGTLLLGVDEEQRQLVLSMFDPRNVHAAVIGMTGSGKSTLMKTMILSAEMTASARVALFDPSGGFQTLSGHPSVWRGGLFRRAKDCEWGLGVLARTLDRGSEGERQTFIFVDEVPELVRQEPQIKDHLGRIAQAGRHVGFHLILGAQHPLASELGSATLRNIPVRLVGRVADSNAAYNATGRNDSGAEHLRGGGDFVAITGTHKRHFQAAMPSPELLEQWVRRYPPRPPRITASPSPAPSGIARLLRRQEPAKDKHHGGGGRGDDEINEDVVAAILVELEQGNKVGARWVRRKAMELLNHDFFHYKAIRHIEEAQKRLHIKTGA